MKLAIYSDVFKDSGFIDDLIASKVVSIEDIVFLHSGNLVKKRKEISCVGHFLFLNLCINSIGMKFAEYLVGEGKIIYATPGDLVRYSARGVNFLIQTGNARMVTCAQDMICIK